MNSSRFYINKFCYNVFQLFYMYMWFYGKKIAPDKLFYRLSFCTQQYNFEAFNHWCSCAFSLGCPADCPHGVSKTDNSFAKARFRLWFLICIMGLQFCLDSNATHFDENYHFSINSSMSSSFNLLVRPLPSV